MSATKLDTTYLAKEIAFLEISNIAWTKKSTQQRILDRKALLKFIRNYNENQRN